MSEFDTPQPSSNVQYSDDPAMKQSYPFGFFVFDDGSIWGRDPLQEANAGLDVSPDEIDNALQLCNEATSDDENDHFGRFDQYDMTDPIIER